MLYLFFTKQAIKSTHLSLTRSNIFIPKAQEIQIIVQDEVNSPANNHINPQIAIEIKKNDHLKTPVLVKLYKFISHPQIHQTKTQVEIQDDNSFIKSNILFFIFFCVIF